MLARLSRLTSPVTSWSSFFVAALCFVITVGVLFSDVPSNGLTVIHLYVFMGLILAMAALEKISSTSGAQRWAFFAIGTVATIMSVGIGGGRSSAQIEAQEVAYKSQLTASKELEKRIGREDKALTDLNVELATLKLTWQRDVENASEKCKPQYGPTACTRANADRDKSKEAMEGKQRTIEEKEAAITALRNQLVTTTPQKDNQILRGISDLVALMFFMDAEHAFALVKKLYPYLIAFMGEGGTIAFSKHAFARRPPEPMPVEIPHETPVTIGDIAKELGIEPRIARKLAREKGISKPAHGAWSWTREQADEIKSRIGQRTLN